MEFRLLGPLEVTVGGSRVNLGGRQRRTLLAILTVHAGRAVSTDRLIDELWGESPPSAARKSVQAHVAHMRRVLNVDEEVLAAADDGYVLQVDDADVDSRRFENLVRRARELRGSDPASAVAMFDEALELFRGAPMSGLTDDALSLRIEANRLQELRLSVTEDRLDALLELGDAGPVAVDAERLVAEHPLRERLWAVLMLALYRSGRQAEALRAFASARQTLAAELGIEPSAELTLLEQRILDRDSELSLDWSPAPEPGAGRRAVVRNPYKGLRAFDEPDSSDFFGRDDLIRRIEEHLEARSGNGLTILAGPSGAGKSSVVRAGLIPRLRERDQAVAVMLPGADPISALAKAIAEVTGDSPQEVADLLGSGRLDTSLVLVVDQFEELFTMVLEHDRLERFLRLMSQGIQPIRWVVTVRADFLDRMLSHTELGRLIDESLLLVPPLQDHEVRAAVLGPAARVGCEVEPDLVSAVVSDVHARPSALPLLQYALTDTFERGSGAVMTVAAYERAGGISGAITRRADELFSSLVSEQQEIAGRMFLELVTLGEEGEIARRRVDRQGLMDLGPEQAVQTIIERFGAIRFLTFDHDPESGAPTVELAHESLVSEWPPLARWIEETRDDLRMSKRLRAAVSEWEASGRDESFLLGGARLVEMESWRESTPVGILPPALDFLRESRVVQDAADKSRTVRRRAIASVLGVAAVVATAFALLAYNQARIATSQRLASASAASLQTDPDLALLLATEAVRSAPTGAMDESAEALHHALQTQRTMLIRPGGGAAFFSPDGQYVTGGGTADVPVWDLETGELAMTLEGHTDLVFNVVWSPDGSLIATNGFDETTRLWDAESGEELWVLSWENRPVSVAFSHDSELLAVSCCRDSSDGWVRVYGIAERELVSEPPVGSALGLNFGNDRDLGIAAADLGLLVWDTAQDREVKMLPITGADVSFSGDGLLMTADRGGDTVVYDTSSWEMIHEFLGQASEGGAIDITSDGRYVASTGVDGAVDLWDLEANRPHLQLPGHGGGVLNVAFSRDGRRLATAGLDNMLRVIDLERAEADEWVTFPSQAGDLDYSPDGELIATGGQGFQLQRSTTGEEVRVLPGSVIRRVQFSGDGSMVAGVGLFDGRVAIYETTGGGLVWETTHPGGVGAVDFSPDGQSVIVGTPEEAVLHSTTNGDVIYRVAPFEDPGSGLTDLEFHPDGESFAASSFVGRIAVRRARDGSELWSRQAFGSFDPRSLQVDYSPDGSFLAAVGFEGTAKVFDPETGEVVATLGSGFGSDLWSLDFSPDGSMLATGGIDGLVTLWETGDWAEVMTLTRVPHVAVSVEFGPDGRTLAVGGLDLPEGLPAGMTRTFVLDERALLDLAEERMARWWRVEECVTYLGTDQCPDAPEGFRGFESSDG